MLISINKIPTNSLSCFSIGAPNFGRVCSESWASSDSSLVVTPHVNVGVVLATDRHDEINAFLNRKDKTGGSMVPSSVLNELRGTKFTVQLKISLWLHFQRVWEAVRQIQASIYLDMFYLKSAASAATCVFLFLSSLTTFCHGRPEEVRVAREL